MSENIIKDMGFEMKENPNEQSASETATNETNAINANNETKDNNSAETTLGTIANITLGIYEGAGKHFTYAEGHEE